MANRLSCSLQGAGCLGFLAGICSGGSRSIIVPLILMTVSTAMIFIGLRTEKEEQYE